ncbi:MAG: ClpXP protease specificity-enhancing factor SspB [Pseudorhodoplanes sp.]|nr:ClpXP protease specificity-enhancing factor SspB [Pseudorhodoplanes sp.]
MATDHIRYDLLAQDALRGVVRTVLTDAARNGLPGDHHFYITLDTRADGVTISPRLKEQYPEEITIVLQHQFWDLKVSEDHFEVGLSFAGASERLSVPFTAITRFLDPSVQFGLQFETIELDAETGEPVAADMARPDTARTGAPAAREEQSETGEKTGADVVRLDRFRKK